MQLKLWRIMLIICQFNFDKIIYYGCKNMQYMEYDDFDKLEEIGSGSYRTVYTAKYKKYLVRHIPETVVINRFKNFDRTQKLFIFEVTFLILIYQLM